MEGALSCIKLCCIKHLVATSPALFTCSLYQVKRLSDNATFDISVMAPGGFANAASQDTFCGSAGCVVQRIYDQSPYLNHLDIAPPGGAAPHVDNPVNATRHPITVGGHDVYAAYFEGGMGYRIDITTGVAQGNEPETLYMVTSGTHFNGGCCFDYGNAGGAPTSRISAACTHQTVASSAHAALF
jgi:non-reducing end alpha-L-arabinofuranosidase